MDFEGRFAEQILPDQLHILNVSFLVPALRRDFGGCAGNIAYSLKILGGTPLPMATLGTDGADYLVRLANLGISSEFVRSVSDTYTAQAMIMTDKDNNQITAFHPGAMMQAHKTKIEKRADIQLGIISPDGRDAMLEHAEQFKHADIPFVFDPGQGLPMFDGKELMHFINLSTWVTVNDYEGKMLCDRTGLSSAEISRHVKGLSKNTRAARQSQRSGGSHRLWRCMARRFAIRFRKRLVARQMRSTRQRSRSPQNCATRAAKLPSQRFTYRLIRHLADQEKARGLAASGLSKR